MKDYVKRMFTKDKKYRLTIFRDDYADNPRYNTDEPLHCEDWDRSYSIMDHDERESRFNSRVELLRYFLRHYGDNNKIVKELKANYKKDSHDRYEMAAFYDFSRRGWVISMWYKGEWDEQCILESGRYDFHIINFDDMLSDECVVEFANKYLSDKIKIASYYFGYNGDVSFSDGVSDSSDGICWLEKEEFMKYSGCDEERWKKPLTEIEWLTDELVAWGDGDVYGFEIEKRVTWNVHRECTSEERAPEDFESEEWENVDSCWGFYGPVDYAIDGACDNSFLRREDLVDED